MPETILVIEEDYATRSCLVDFLENHFIVIAASDGPKGLQLSREAEPDLIICDIDMPYLNSYPLLEQWLADMNNAHIPLIFISAQSCPDKISLALEMGTYDYIVNPINLSQLLVNIQSRLEKKQLFRGFSLLEVGKISPGQTESDIFQYKYGWGAKKYLNSNILKAVDDLHNYGHMAAYRLNHNS